MNKNPVVGDLVAAKHDSNKIYLICGEMMHPKGKDIGVSFTLLRVQDQVKILTPFLTVSQMERYFEVLANMETNHG